MAASSREALGRALRRPCGVRVPWESGSSRSRTVRAPLCLLVRFLRGNKSLERTLPQKSDDLRIPTLCSDRPRARLVPSQRCGSAATCPGGPWWDPDRPLIPTHVTRPSPPQAPSPVVRSSVIVCLVAAWKGPWGGSASEVFPVCTCLALPERDLEHRRSWAPLFLGGRELCWLPAC